MISYHKFTFLWPPHCEPWCATDQTADIPVYPVCLQCSAKQAKVCLCFLSLQKGKHGQVYCIEVACSSCKQLLLQRWCDLQNRLGYFIFPVRRLPLTSQTRKSPP